jgi:hypothetical protein
MNDLFEIDILAPVQFQNHFGPRSLTPQQRLMLAVLADAIECFQKYAAGRDGKSEQLFRDAQRWIFEGRSDWPFSFENICDILGMDAGYIRRGLSGTVHARARAMAAEDP